MAHDFYIKQNDLLPEIEVTCIREDTGAVVDLTAATAVVFKMRKRGTKPGSEKVDAAASFEDKPNGVVKYTWAGTDTDTKGDWDAEFQVTIGGKPITFPNHEYLRIRITGDIS